MRRPECGKLSLSSGTGLFVTFEGGEGAGKSTQIRRLAEALKGEGHEVLVTREPGGSPGAEAVRHVLLSGAAEAFGTRMEAILFAAARNDHVEEVIRPALTSGKIVLCDGRSPFEIEPPSEEWSDQLLGFGWLRHLRAAESAITRANARALVDEAKRLSPRGLDWWS